MGVPGHACACQVVQVAAWSAVASWVAAQGDQMVVAVAGTEPVEEFLVPDRPGLGTIVDPAVEELAPALRVSPGSARNRLAGLRRIAELRRLRDAVDTGLVIGWHAICWLPSCVTCRRLIRSPSSTRSWTEWRPDARRACGNGR